MRLRFNRHKTFSTVLNVIGLTLAFSVFLILTVQVVYDTRYDLNYPDTDKIVRLEYSDPTSPGVYGVQLSRPFIENLKTFFPQAEAVSCYWYYKNGNRSPFKEANTETPGIMLRYTQTDFDLLRVFPFDPRKRRPRSSAASLPWARTSSSTPRAETAVPGAS